MDSSEVWKNLLQEGEEGNMSALTSPPVDGDAFFFFWHSAFVLQCLYHWANCFLFFIGIAFTTEPTFIQWKEQNTMLDCKQSNKYWIGGGDKLRQNNRWNTYLMYLSLQVSRNFSSCVGVILSNWYKTLGWKENRTVGKAVAY